jgi:hypothetical protein
LRPLVSGNIIARVGPKQHSVRELIIDVLEKHNAGYIDERRVEYSLDPYVHGLSGPTLSNVVNVLATVCIRYLHYHEGALQGESPASLAELYAEDPDDLDEFEAPLKGEPPPLLEPTHLTTLEIAWALDWAKRRAAIIGAEHEVGLACCVAALLPFFKSGHIAQQKSVCIKRYLLEDAAASGWPERLWQPDAVLDVLGVMHVATQGGVYAEGPRAASYALTVDVPFTATVPDHSLEPGPRITPELRFNVLQAAVRGEDWRAILGPLETAGLRHLMPEEFRQLVARFDVAPGQPAFDSIEVGVFCTQLMPRLKHAFTAGHTHALLTEKQLTECMLGRQRQQQPFKIAVESSGLIEFVPGWTSPLREPHFAVRVRAGAFTFSVDAPKRPLCLRSGHDRAVRWASIKTAAQDRSGR